MISYKEQQHVMYINTYAWQDHVLQVNTCTWHGHAIDVVLSMSVRDVQDNVCLVKAFELLVCHRQISTVYIHTPLYVCMYAICISCVCTYVCSIYIYMHACMYTCMCVCMCTGSSCDSCEKMAALPSAVRVLCSTRFSKPFSAAWGFG